MNNIFYYNTAVGRVGIAEKAQHITNVFLEADFTCNESTDKQGMVIESKAGIRGIINTDEYTVIESVLLKEAHKQLTEYLSGIRKAFSLPLAPVGTPYMKKVWECLCQIPYGETRSYREIAEATGNPKASRAVGNANNRNPIPLFIPCHRVIGANGKLTGYRGGLEMKLKLLEIEKSYANI